MNSPSDVPLENEPDLDAQLDEIMATPEQIQKEIDRIDADHAAEVRRRISTPATELMKNEPDKKHLFFKPLRPQMIPMEKHKIAEHPAGQITGESDRIDAENQKRAKLMYGLDVPDAVRIGVVKRWNTQSSMAVILGWANDNMRKLQRATLEAIDIFAIVNYELVIQTTRQDAGDNASPSRTERVKGRVRRNEMNLEQFRTFFSLWKKGQTCEVCMHAAAFENKYFGQSRFKELNARWRVDERSTKKEKAIRKANPLLTIEVMEHARRIVMDDVTYFAIPIAVLPNDLIEYARSVPVCTERLPPAPIVPVENRQHDEEEDAGMSYNQAQDLENLDAIAAEDSVPFTMTPPQPTFPPVDDPDVPQTPLSATDDAEFEFE